MVKMALKLTMVKDFSSSLVLSPVGCEPELPACHLSTCALLSPPFLSSKGPQVDEATFLQDVVQVLLSRSWAGISICMHAVPL